MSRIRAISPLRLSLLALLALVVAQGSNCTGGGVNLPGAIALDGTYNLTVVTAETGSPLPVGATGPVVIANGLLTSFLRTPVTNPLNPTGTGNQFKWIGTIAAPGNPLLTGLITLDLTNQGGGTLAGLAFYTVLNVQTPTSTVTLTRV